MLRINLACACAVVSLFSASVLADSSYQFSVGFNASKFDYDGGGNGEAYGLNAAAYLEPIQLSNALPYNLTPFYTRTSGLFLNTSKSRGTGFNLNRSGRILKKSDSHRSSAAVRLASAELPVWLGLNYSREGSANFYFSDGTKAVSDRRYVRSATLGGFIDDHLGVYGFYQADDNDADSYGVGVHYLHKLGNLQFLEASFQYTKIDTEQIGISIVDGTVRNINVTARDESIKTFSLRFFPVPKAEFGFRYQYLDYDYDQSAESVNLNASYHVLPALQLGVSYYEYFPDSLAERLGRGPAYNTISGQISVKF